MSAPSDGWVALEDASSAFERPSWAIRALVDQGKLERKVEDGRVYVRAPRDAEPARASAPAPAREDPAPALATAPVSDDETPAPNPELAASLDALVAELEALGADADRDDDVVPPAPLALAPAVAPSPAPLSDPRDSALFRELAADLADLAHATRARDQLLARAAQALRAVEAASRAPLEKPRPRPAPWALAGILALAAAGAFMSARFESETADAAREEARIALRHATLLETQANREKKRCAAIASVLLASAPAPLSSASVLPAGYSK